MKERLANAVFWIVWSRGVVQVISFLSTLVVMRLLSPKDYGLMALASVWTSILALLTDSGLGPAIVQFRDLEERELNACFWITMGGAGVVYGGLYAAAPAIAAWFASPALADVLRIVGLALPLTAVRVVPDGLLRKCLAFNKISQAEIVALVLTTPVVIGMASAGAGVWALVAGALTTSLVHSVATFWFVRWWPGLRLGGGRVRAILSFSVAALGSRVCWSLYHHADTVVLGKVSGEATVGFYSVARHIATLPSTKISGVINKLAFPVMAELQANREALRTSLLRAIRLVSWGTFPLCIGLILVAQDLVQVALTEKWAPIVPTLQVLCLYVILRSIVALFPPVLMARYRAKFLFHWNLVLLGVMPLVFWAGAAWSGPVGVATAWAVVYPILAARMVHETLGEVNISWWMLGRQLWPPMAVSLIMSVAVLWVRWGTSAWDNDLVAVRLVMVTLAGAAAYVAGLLWIGGPVRGEIQKVFGWLLSTGHGAVKA